MNNPDAGGWMSVPAAAKQLGVKSKVIYNWIDRGHVRPIRHEHRMVVFWDDVLDVDLATRKRDRTGRAARRVGDEVDKAANED